MSSVAFSNCWIWGMVVGKEASGPSSVRRKVTGGASPGRGPSAGHPEKALRDSVSVSGPPAALLGLLSSEMSWDQSQE